MFTHVVRIAAAVMLLVVPTFASAGEPFSWQESHANVLPQGDLEWTPKPFRFEKGRLARATPVRSSSRRNSVSGLEPLAADVSNAE